MKNILFISDSSITNPILSSQGLPQLQLLSKRGFRVYVLSWETEDDIYSIRLRTEIYKKYESELFFLPTTPTSFIPFARAIQHFFFRIFIVLFYIMKYDIAMIHSRSYMPAILGLLFQKLLGIKFIFDMRGLLIDEMISVGKWKNNSLRVRSMRLLEKQCILNANAIVVVSEQFRQYILNLSYVSGKQGINIEVIPTCVDLERFQVGTKDRNESLKSKNLEDRIIFLYSGSLTGWQLAEEVVNFFI